METYDNELHRIRSLLKNTTSGLTVTEIARHIDLNRNSVAKYLDILLTSGQVEKKLVGSAKIFTLTNRVPVSSILSLSSDYIFVLDDDAVITYVNENILKFEKKTYDEIVGKTLADAEVSLLSAPEILPVLKEAFAGKEHIQEIARDGDGGTWFFRAKFVPAILENRKRGLMIVLEDITESKKYQEHLEETVASRNAELKGSKLILKQEIRNHEEAKSALEESERRYKNLIDLAEEGIWTFDAEGTTTFVNQKMSEILGYPSEEMDGKSILSFATENDRQIISEKLYQIKDGDTAHFEAMLERKDGTSACARISASGSIDADQAFRYGLFVVSDISELKKADDALRVSELHYRTIIETSPNGIIVFDLDGNIRMVNIQAARMLGHKSCGELVGKNVFDYIAPNDFEKSKAQLQKTLEKGYTKNFECGLISKDSAPLCAELSVSTTIDRMDMPTGFVSVLSDITERRRADDLVRKSEEKHRALVEGISHIIFTTDMKGKFTYVSPVIQRLLGYTHDELIGKHFYTLVPSEERHILGQKLKEAQSGKLSPDDFRMIDKAGVTHWGRIIAQPLIEGGTLRGITGLIGDITDWKRTEDLLRASELQYTAVVQDLIDLICRFRPDLTITFVNPAYCRFYRRKEQDFLDQSFLSFIPEKSQETIRAIITSLTPHNPVKTSEYQILGPDGVIHWHHVTIRGIFDEQGEIIEFQSSSRDLTELKLYFDRSNALLHELQSHQAELEAQNEELKKLRAEAQRSEQKYLDLYNFAPVGYFTLDTNGKIIEVNQTGSALLGGSPHQLMNASFQDFIAQEHRAEFAGFCTRISESSRKQTCEVDLKRDGDTSLTLQIEGKAMGPANGDGRHYRIIIIDVTERKRSDSALKESETRLRAIIHGSPNPHYVIDKNHQLIYWNKAMSVITGIKAKDIIGTSNHWMAFFSEERPCMADLLVDGTPEKIARWFPDNNAKSRMAEGAYEAFMYFPELGKSGKWFHFTAAAIRDAQDVIIGALETVDDITELRLAEESAKNANKKLNMLNSVTRHDIINEMTIWSGYMDLLEEKLPEHPEVKKHADRAKAASRAVQRLVAFTRDYQNLGVEPATWHEVDDLVTYAAATANLRDIDVVLRTNSVKIFADPLIKKVFFNLIDNSLRHGGHVTKIGVFFRELHDNGVIIVKDNGVGIPAAVKNKLFRRGFGKHTGFGMYLSKEILNITGISIRETGEPGKGARFEMVVPKDSYRF